LTEKQKWCSEHKLTEEEFKQLIQNKLERALKHLEAREKVNFSLVDLE
jgi:hypothetical protein